MKVSIEKTEFKDWQKRMLSKLPGEFLRYFRLDGFVKDVRFVPIRSDTGEAGSSNFRVTKLDEEEVPITWDFSIWVIELDVQMKKGEFRRAIFHELIHNLFSLLSLGKADFYKAVGKHISLNADESDDIFDAIEEGLVLILESAINERWQKIKNKRAGDEYE